MNSPKEPVNPEAPRSGEDDLLSWIENPTEPADARVPAADAAQARADEAALASAAGVSADDLKLVISMRC